MNLTLAQLRLFQVILALGLLLTIGLEQAQAEGITGYLYTAMTNDTLELIAAEYRDQGVDVTVEQILAQNPKLKLTTNTEAGVTVLIPEIGTELFIPDKLAGIRDLMGKAAKGDADAEFTIGKYYYEGSGVVLDKSEAVKWMERAANHGIAEAQTWVGIHYWDGIDVKMDEAKGMMWLQKAADQGEPGAFHFLGGAYYLGKGVKQDYVQCYKWTLLFMETGSSSIPDDPASLKAQLADVESKLTPEQIKEGKRLAKEAESKLSKLPRYANGNFGCKTTSETVQVSTIPAHLTEPLRFANFTVSQIYSKEGITNLLNQRVYAGTEDPTPDCYDWFRRSDQTNTLKAETINEFRSSIEHDFYDSTTQDRIRFGWFQSASDILAFMQKAQPSQHSYLAKRYLMELPVTVLESSLNCCEGDVSDQYEKILKRDLEKGKTLKDYTWFFAPIHVTKVKQQANTLSFYDADFEIDYFIKELARGDLDGDGNEDALIEIGWHTQGTMGGSYTEVVTRTGPGLKLKRVADDSFLKCSPNIVKLVGTITKVTFPGPPNYKSVKRGDAPEDYWILKLESPVNVAEDPDYPVPDENSPQLDVSELQIDLDGDYKTYEKLLGKRVEVTGELSQGFTVHHKTPVMIGVSDIKLAE